jgi:hypothetical protein
MKKRAHNFQDLTGMRYGRLVVMAEIIEGKRTRWLCLCDCGNKKDVDAVNLRAKNGTKSCGCIRRENSRILMVQNKGDHPWNKGLRGVQYNPRAEESAGWKGAAVGYHGIHSWIHRNYGKASKCEMPGCKYPRPKKDGRLMDKPKRYHWSNKSGEYKRDMSDWWQLCPSCHRTYDFKNGISMKKYAK